MNRQKNKRVIISGGGTGGHVFPAIAIANALKKLEPSLEILFVGALGRLEMELVPKAGYNIVGLPVAGINRKNPLKNISVLWKFIKSLRTAGTILRDFKPDVVVGVGGYASGPVIKKALSMKIPVLIQEQNSYAGITNRLFAKKASVICVAYDGMEKYFPASRIIKTGNPLRQSLGDIEGLKDEALRYFNIKSDRPVILVLGGSLGAGSINKCLAENIEKIRESGLYWIWQTGRNYFEDINALVSVTQSGNISVYPFIERMDLAYSAADIIISRAGAGTISELCLVGKPVILVPSPNVAEDHQTKNAMALAEKEAAVIVRDSEVNQKLIDEVLSLADDIGKRNKLSENIRKLAMADADLRIAEEVIKLMDR
ncbi:MAG TPA: undecaprenyldiphospho-muramoylpentapeptide beta-N-acetylglucosaminyltransferase [Bacteroidales bacterium]|nr:undecaprenyldiphospho-muramoylpentapeptide beta-N-acetylglucosaminyltransferase [Bacteroidales bacterium]